MLPKGQHVRDVLSQDGGVFSNARPGTLIMDSSTVDIETSRWCHEEAPKHGVRFVDAPVSGGTSGAAAATLAFMIG
ncbi:3-hydroxyisobutyrate dehydrogenase, partial [Xanthomonas citri pv. citri]|nr:3-hydroxyisobutyrate dehydrogenase [Xanthomonas citri pv. citri]